MSLEIHQELEIGVPVERVFAAWTTPGQLIQWWGDDDSYHVTDWECDLRVGGKWVSRGKGKDGKPFVVQGEYTRVDPPHHLAFSWTHDWAGVAETTHVALELIATKTGTLLKLHHTGFENEQSCAGHSQGWIRVTGWMKAFVEARK